jgi:hypothetical protein
VLYQPKSAEQYHNLFLQAQKTNLSEPQYDFARWRSG